MLIDLLEKDFNQHFNRNRLRSFNEAEGDEVDLDSDEPITDENLDNNDQTDANTKNSNINPDEIDLNSDEPITDENLGDNEGDADNSDDSYAADTDNDSVSSKISQLQSELDKGLDNKDKQSRKIALYTIFENSYRLLEEIYNLFENTLTTLGIKYDYRKQLDDIISVKEAIYQYMTIKYNEKEYLESKSFLMDIFIYLLELNKIITNIKVDEKRNKKI